MSDNQTTDYRERLLERASEIIDYFTSKPPAQIIENLLSRVEKDDTPVNWERLEEYVRECEKVRFDNEYSRDESGNVY